MFTIIGGDGREYGPVSAEQIRRWIAAGRANLETRAKAAGSDEWKPLGEFPDVVASPSVEPPPLSSTVETDATRGGGPGILALPLASRAARLAAAIIDLFVSLLCLIPLVIAMAASIGPDRLQQFQDHPDQVGTLFDPATHPNALGGLYGMYALMVLVTAAQVTLLALRGQTFGKLITRVRIVRFPDGAPAGLVRAWLLRSLVVSMMFWFAYRVLGDVCLLLPLLDIGFIFRQDRRCLHDLLAGTMVVPT